MKSLKYLILAIAVLFGCSITRAQCSIVYSLNYAVSTALTYDTTNPHLNIHTSVITSGSATMSIQVQGTCPDGIRTQLQNAINTATHAASTFNKVGPTGGSWATGPTKCASCWLSEENDQVYVSTILAPTTAPTTLFNYGGHVTFSYGSQIFCNVGGTLAIINPFNFIDVAFAGTFSKLSGAPICVAGACLQGLIPWCSNTDTPTWNPNSLVYAQGLPPTPVVFGLAFCGKITNGTWHCTLAFYKNDVLETKGPCDVL